MTGAPMPCAPGPVPGVGEPPLVGLECGEDGACLGDVDHGGLAGLGVVDEIGVVV